MDAAVAFRAARDRLIELREDHARAADEFDWPDVGPSFDWATDWFDRIADGNDRTALWIVEEDGGEQRVSFARMRERSDRVAAWLAAQGVAPGDHVMLMLGNQVELWESMLAVMKLGAVILPTTVVLAPHDLADRIERGLVKHVVANAADAAKFARLDGFTRIAVGGPVEGWLDYADADAFPGDRPVVAVRSDDPCLVYFTSGTTSRPKMVVHTRTSYPVGHLTTLYWLGLEPGDVHLAISSPGWAKHAWSCFFAPWNAEAAVFVVNSARFDPVALRARLDEAGVTTFCAPPTVWRMLIQADLGARPAALREALSAGEPLNPEVIDRVRDAWGLVVRDGYGQTETTATIANTPGSPMRSGSMGVPLPGVAITLVDPITGERADEGEICIDLERPAPNLMAGYLGVPGTGRATTDRYYRTGDVARRDEGGVITFIGRTDDVFKSSDYKVSPFEVESVLIRHPAVAEAAVVPAPDPVRLNLVKAYVALAPGWAPDADTALAVLRHAPMPHRLATILRGESLLNDAASLLLYRLAVGAAMAGSFTITETAPGFLLGVTASVVVGPLLGLAFVALTRRVSDPATAIVLQFVAAFGLWLLAERVEMSGVLVVVTFAMMVARKAPGVTAPRARIVSYAVWDTAVFVINVLAFVLIGIQIDPILARLNGTDQWQAIAMAAAVFVTVTVARIAWILPTSGLRGFGLREHGERVRLGAGVAVSWAGMRGIVTVAAALALPGEFPHRDLVVFTAFCTVFGTLVVQGLTLSPLLRFLNLPDDDPVGREAGRARAAAYGAALKSLETQEDCAATNALKAEFQQALAEAEAHEEGLAPESLPADAARRSAILAARTAVLEMRRRGEIGDDAYFLLEEEFDWAELSATPRAES